MNELEELFSKNLDLEDASQMVAGTVFDAIMGGIVDEEHRGLLETGTSFYFLQYLKDYIGEMQKYSAKPSRK